LGLSVVKGHMFSLAHGRCICFLLMDACLSWQHAHVDCLSIMMQHGEETNLYVEHLCVPRDNVLPSVTYGRTILPWGLSCLTAVQYSLIYVIDSKAVQYSLLETCLMKNFSWMCIIDQRKGSFQNCLHQLVALRSMVSILYMLSDSTEVEGEPWIFREKSCLMNEGLQ
jgi:hypothetical protein